MAKEYSHVKLAGSVFAVVNLFVTLGGVILQPLVGRLLDFTSKNLVVNGVHVYSTHDYQVALSILPISLIDL